MNQITCPHCADTYPDFDVAHVCSRGPYAPKLKPKTNERIKELAEQAGYKHPDAVGRCEDYAYFDHEKFAELIVRECLTICEELGDKGMDGHYCADTISKTFWS
jgi:hypothetical protein